jgi:AAA domain
MATTATIPIREKLGVKPPAQSIRWLNGMFFGEYGVGKTHLLGTATEHEMTRPLLIFDIDGGVSTLSQHEDIDVVQVRSYDEMVDAIIALRDSVDKDGEIYYKTIGVDTFSEFAGIDLAYIMRQRAEENARLDEDVADQYGYNKSGAHLRRVVRMLRDLPCNTILTSHVADVQDSLGRIQYYPMLAGKLRKQIPGFLDFVGYMKAEVDGDEIVRSIQFTKTDRVAAKQRSCGFDEIELNPTIPGLWQKRQQHKENGSK